MPAAPLLAIPPFPGARARRFAEPLAGETQDAPPAAELLAALARHRVGGAYWGRQPALPMPGYTLDGTAAPVADAVAWQDGLDPWHVLDGAGEVRLPEGDARGLLALAAGGPLVWCAADGTARSADAEDPAMLLAQNLTGYRWINPFDGRPMPVTEAIALCGQWRALIDANRAIHSVMGIAYWKKPTVTALLWGGSPVPYNRPLQGRPEGAAVALWRARLPAAQARAIERERPPIIEIEDGFIRSAGLGADCVPPLSIIIDPLGPHFAPGAPSTLERLLEQGDFPEDLLVRARALRTRIIAAGLSKYEAGGTAALARPGDARRHVLVPGQVEDDRAVTSGGALSSNLELLRRARAEAGPEAFVIYKPHPDVLAGHRRGAIPEEALAGLADHVETTNPMAALIAMADELHVNSSLAGFEALLRGKPVTVHGVPFYAGWGLTRDLGPVPARRTAKRTLDELVAAALLLYPRYLDPKTGLPCPVEVLVGRLSVSDQRLDTAAAAVVAARRTVGRVNRLIRG
jgi:capsular polysaccharide export protein